MAFIDTRELDDGTIINADLCIIGAGPAGLALAEEFIGTKTRIALIESGGLNYDGPTQQLSIGKVVGIPYPQLMTARARLFGGASIHWGGNVRRLDPHDFKAHDWIASSGWPIDYAEMAPYYDRAVRFCGLPDDSYDPAAHLARAKDKPWRFHDDELRTVIFNTLSFPGRWWGKRDRGLFATAENITTYLYANITDIHANEAVDHVTSLTSRTLSGKTHTFRAKRYVLATGGLENPRVLLLANRQQQAGLGNEHDLVGRYFMEHLTNPNFGRLFPSNKHLPIEYYRGKEEPWGDSWGMFVFSDEVRVKNRLPNIRFQLATVKNSFNINKDKPGFRSLEAVAKNDLGDKDLGWHIANIIADIDSGASAAYERLMHYPNYPLEFIKVVFISEQTPNPNSRITLGTDTDALGQRRIVFDWEVDQNNVQGITRACRLFADAMGKSGLGRFENRFPEDGFASEPPHPHYHHMGTTRMAADPRHGVVNADCRMHQLDNLYVAGSSVFPTCGNVNPTQTIVALAIRLADHLKATA